jgi:hypothetical protein
MSILSALKQQSSSIDDLAKLPQAMIMQMAQKKQISQDMLAPILSRKAEMMDAVSRSKALQQPAPQLSVMEQMMAKNIEAENPANTVPAQPQPQAMPQVPEEAGVAQLPIPERQYAGGGIVAFARGDLVDLDEEDDENDILAEYAQAMAQGERAASMGADMPAREIPAQNAGVGLRYTEPMPKGGSQGINYKGGKHPYESLVAAKAQEYGVDPALASYILNKETGGMKNPENARSSAGAMGIAQFMPATAKQYGINPDIPEEAAIGMGKHLRYLMDKYENPKLAAIAYNWGEGNTNKWLKAGADMDKLPKETKKYVASLASGGEIKHFDTGGLNKPFITDPRGVTRVPQYPLALYKEAPKLSPYAKFMRKVPYLGAALTAAEGIDALVDSDTGTASEFLDPIAAMQGTQGGYERPVKKENIYDQMAKDAKTENAPKLENAPKSEPSVPMKKTSSDEDSGPYLNPNASAAAAAATPAVTPKSAFEMFMEQNDLDRAALGKQRKDDQNMALLAAGLGMLGGGSQYAFENIGKGGLSGVQYLSEANKQRAAEKAALDKNRVAAAHYENIGKYYGSQTLSKDERAELQRQKLTEDKIKSARDDYFQYQKMVEEGFNKQYPIAAVTPDDPTTIKLKQEWLAKHSPILESLRSSAYPNLPKMSSSSALQSQADAIINPKKGN